MGAVTGQTHAVYYTSCSVWIKDPPKKTFCREQYVPTQSKLWVQLSKYQQLTRHLPYFPKHPGVNYNQVQLADILLWWRKPGGSSKKLEEWKLIIIVGTRNMKSIRQQLTSKETLQKLLKTKIQWPLSLRVTGEKNTQSGSKIHITWL